MQSDSIWNVLILWRIPTFATAEPSLVAAATENAFEWSFQAWKNAIWQGFPRCSFNSKCTFKPDNGLNSEKFVMELD